MRESKKYSKEEHDRITVMAKKMIVFEMMRKNIVPDGNNK